ncbi:MAG: Asp-tRNA(Asn)/Glu-tRNA(Gln) amidotransferase subunit GatC [Coriobacteriia bacterium]|nr:Asp-tRNA(Asn)/Glu-tRNA(Gln) amidotransferase subunit GatC [Coriobacteriia bacterium]
MALSPQDVRAIADYARIAVKDEELEELADYFNSMMDTLNLIKKYDIEDVEPTFHPIGGLVNVMREDEQGDSFTIEQTLKNAPEFEDRLFKVPTILGGDE